MTLSSPPSFRDCCGFTAFTSASAAHVANGMLWSGSAQQSQKPGLLVATYGMLCWLPRNSFHSIPPSIPASLPTTTAPSLAVPGFPAFFSGSDAAFVRLCAIAC